MLTTLAVANYRSLLNLVAPLGALNLITGANGSGKSNFYRALRLLAETAQGGVVGSLSREGGLNSTLWAGPEKITHAMRIGEREIRGTARQERVNMRLGFASSEYSYSIELGLPPQTGETRATTAFADDPEIKRECIWAGEKLRPSTLLVDRGNDVVRTRGESGGWEVFTSSLPNFESVLAHVTDPARAPEALLLREQIRSWRFYDHFRTDAEAPARQPQLGTRTPVLSHDGRDLAAALQTIREIGDRAGMEEAVSDAFPGAELTINHDNGRFVVELHQHGLLRPLSAAELSDGTLRYLLWIAALLTPRPPSLMILNEPETSLHPDLLAPLARLIATAAKSTQVIVVSHAPGLIAALEDMPACHCLHLEKELGETRIAGLRELDKPAWSWPAR